MSKELKVLVKYVLTTVGEKVIALCDIEEDGKTVDDFSISTGSLKETLLKLKEKAIELSIPLNRMEILGEFDSDELSEEDYEIWSTSLKDLH